MIKTAFDEQLVDRLRKACLLTDQQLKLMREHPATAELSLTDALVTMELLSQSEIDQIVCSIHDARMVKLEDIPIDIEAVRHVPRHVAVTNRCMPIRRTGKSLVVAVCDSNFEDTKLALQNVTDFEIVIVCAEQEALEHALFIYYGADPREQEYEDGSAKHYVQGSIGWTLQPAWKCTFENFYSHAGVSKAKEVAKQIASTTTELFELPIVFVGTNGSGKTHLLRAIENYCSRTDPLLRGLYVTGSQIRSAIADYRIANKLNALRFALRDSDLLFIDDFADSWGSGLVESEIATLIDIRRQKNAVTIVTLTSEQFVTGPSAAELRETLSRGTEVSMSAPDHDALLSILNLHGCGANRDNRVKQLPGLSPNELTWSLVQDEALSRNWMAGALSEDNV